MAFVYRVDSLTEYNQTTPAREEIEKIKKDSKAKDMTLKIQSKMIERLEKEILALTNAEGDK